MMAGTAMPEHRAFETEDGVIAVDWQFGESCLEMRVNLSQETHAIPPFRGQPIFASEAAGERTPDVTELAGPGIVVAIAR